MSLTCLDNAINLLLYLYSNSSVFSNIFFYVFRFISFLFFENLKFRISFDKTGSAL